MYRERFAAQTLQAVNSSDVLRAAVETEDWSAVEHLVTEMLMNKPEDFWSLPKLRELYKTDREPSLREILQVILGSSPKVATRQELSDEQFQRFLNSEPGIDPTRARELEQVFHAVMLDPLVLRMIRERNFAALRSLDAAVYEMVRTLDKEQVSKVLAYVLTRSVDAA